MSKNSLLLSGDQFFFDSIQGANLLIPKALFFITGSGNSDVLKRKICVEGDESSVVLPGIPYNTSTHSIPGVLICKIKSLADDNISKKTFELNKKALMVGDGNVEVEYIVAVPAIQPNTPPVPDIKPFYSGKGSFKPLIDMGIELDI
ncbi:hypothetical protein [Fluviispira multicolorata]|uniref:Uncharacterized protein n=1 Tax=Fluviispira multicolorata TaxID=2654512 RepID=A0A833JDI3_9BACT|nr:hypothetical protein [Fluviispira multicolorata]KAB8031903.1 hypothetical protein GCL57_04465 [Fluviispira multicolorata]